MTFTADEIARWNFDIDLTGHEITRRAAVMAAIDWDPTEAFAAEEQAYRMLYSGLDPVQEKVLADLIAAGVIPRVAP